MKKTKLGSWLQIPNEINADIFANSKLEWFVIDLEHAPFDKKILSNIIRILKSKKKLTIIRINEICKSEIQQSLDLGADGIIAPNVCSENDVKKLINFSLYPPQGSRGMGLVKSNEYGDNFTENCKSLNKSIKLFIMIESKEGYKNLAKILNHKSIYGVAIGPYDLSTSLGCPGNFKSQKFKKIENDIYDKSKVKGKKLLYHLVKNYSDLKKIKHKYDYLGISSDILMLKKTLNEIT